MASPIPIYREYAPSGELEKFFAPFYQVKISGRNLPNDVVNDVMSVTYKDKVDDLDSFELTINNWDADLQAFKYEPAQKKYKGLFDPGQRVEVWMGYVKDIRQMLVGEITTIQPNFPESGGPTLVISGLNILHGLRKKQHTYAWEAKDGWTDSKIASWMGKQPVSDNAPGLGLTVETPNADEEMPDEFVFMNNQYDIVFLIERARRRGYTVRLELDGKNQKPLKLIFGRQETKEKPVYELEWGKTLVSFRPTLQTANQISQVTVRGWDRKTKSPIEGTAKFPEDAKSNADWKNRIALAVNGRIEEVTDKPVRDKKEADSLAKKILNDQAQVMVTAQAATVGLPDLRAGSAINILGFGARRVNGQIKTSADTTFDGAYFVTETTHVINDQGYRTTFGAQRTGGLIQ